MQNKELAEELHKQLLENLKNEKVHSLLTDNIWGTFSWNAIIK